MKLSEFIISFGFGALFMYLILLLINRPTNLFPFGLDSNKQDNQTNNQINNKQCNCCIDYKQYSEISNENIHKVTR